MSKQSVMALLQAVLGSLGGLLIGQNIFGIPIDQAWIGTAVGVLLGLVSVVWGFRDHTETIEQFQAGIRNLISFLTVLLISGGIPEGKLKSITGALDALLPVIYGFLSRQKNADLQKKTISPMSLKTNIPKSSIIILLVIVGSLMASNANAQFFRKDPLPTGKSLVKVGASSSTVVQNSWHPLVGVTASFSDATSLAGGVGVGFFHRSFDDPSQSWTTQYSISGLAFLDTRGSVIGGLALGVLGIFSIGPSYNFTNGKFGFMTGVSFTPF